MTNEELLHSDNAADSACQPLEIDDDPSPEASQNSSFHQSTQPFRSLDHSIQPYSPGTRAQALFLLGLSRAGSGRAMEESRADGSVRGVQRWGTSRRS